MHKGERKLFFFVALILFFCFSFLFALNGDFNNDGKIDVRDLGILFSFWGRSNSDFDLNKDGKIGVFEVGELFSEWGRGKEGCTIYVDKNIQDAIQQAHAGDIICVEDGIYNEPLAVVSKQGKEGQPIIIKAINDGKVVFDGRYETIPCRVENSSYITIDGFVCQRSSASVVSLKNSHHIVVRRTSAYDVKPRNCNCHSFLVYRSENVLLEDVVAGGRARTMFNIYGSENIILTRVYARWEKEPLSNSPGVNNLAQIYGSAHVLIENAVGTMDSSASNSVLGWGVWNNYYNESLRANNNRIIGSIAYNLSHAGFYNSACKWNIHNNRFENIVSLNNKFGIWQRGDDSQTINHYTQIGGEIAHYVEESRGGACEPFESGFSIGSDMKNSIIEGVRKLYAIKKSSVPKNISHDYNLLWDNQSLGDFILNTHETQDINPGFNVEKWGLGAYLFPSSVRKGRGEGNDFLGADIRYRYENGILTSTPLWPWPMEERVCDELGVSVTWEESEQISQKTKEKCKGGLWKTLEGVY